MSDEILTSVNEGVLEITINRPDQRNCVNAAVARGIAAAIDRLDSEDDLRCAILTGAGGTFCAGMDLKAWLKGESAAEGGRGFGGICSKPPNKPIIAAVDGYALAGGTEISLACDMIVARRDAQFGIPEVKRSLVAAARGVIYLPRLLPRQLAMELALTGDPIGAERLAELGVVNRLTDGPAIEAARELAASIAANGPLALMATKALMRDSWNWEIDELEKRQNPYIKDVFASEDAREGASAFAEKRKPVWKGK
jgi:enoyl-CoA hydratase